MKLGNHPMHQNHPIPHLWGMDSHYTFQSQYQWIRQVYSRHHHVLVQEYHMHDTYCVRSHRKKLGNHPMHRNHPSPHLWGMDSHYTFLSQCQLIRQLYNHLHHVLVQDYHTPDTYCVLPRHKKLGNHHMHQNHPIHHSLGKDHYYKFGLMNPSEKDTGIHPS
jgi:hypothetical protein